MKKFLFYLILELLLIFVMGVDFGVAIMTGLEPLLWVGACCLLAVGAVSIQISNTLIEIQKNPLNLHF